MTVVSKRSTSRLSLAVAVSSIVGALVLVVVFLQRNGLWMDELYTLHAIRLPLREMIYERLRRGHFPLYFMLQKEVVALFFGGKYNEISLRVLSTAGYFAAVISFALLARRFLNPTAAAMAITLFAFNGLALRQAVEARMYTLALLEGVWILRAYFEMASGAGRPVWKWVLMGMTLVGVWTSPSVALLVAVLSMDAWFRRRSSPGLLRWTFLALVVGIATLVPGLLVHIETRQKTEVAHVPPIWLAGHLVTFVSGIFADDDYFKPSIALRVLQGIGAVVTIGVVFSALRRWRKLPELEKSCLRIVTLPVLIMLVTWGLSYVVRIQVNLLGPARYIIGVMSCGALLAASQIASWTEGFPRRTMLSHIAVFALLASGAVLILTVEFEPGRGRSFRWLMKELREHYHPGDGVITVPNEIADGVQMYVRNLKVDVAIDRWMADKDKLTEMIKPLGSRPKVWVVWYRGRESAALDVATGLFGEPVSSGFNNDRGMLRLFLFTPSGSH